MEDLNNDPQVRTRGQWQWKSNQDPWLKEQEEQWMFYPPEHNYYIEKAAYEQKDEVEIGDYIISIKDQIQRKKEDIASQRPIRRVEIHTDEEVDCRQDRCFDIEIQKTMNKSFGTLEDLLHFFQGRNPEMRRFLRKLLKIIQDNNLIELNENVVPRIIDCIKKESANVQGDTVQANLKSLLALFEVDFSSFPDFYGHIIKAYSLSTFLYRSINIYLREENWKALDSLLPYVVCLCVTFGRIKQESSMLNTNKKGSLILYRGTTVHKDAISLYNFKTMKTFSWYSVTSTTRNKNVTERFMFTSSDPKTQKIPVLFEIEVPLTAKNNSSYIDIKLFSKFPREEEVLLAPGSIFQVQSVEINADKLTVIKLCLITDVEKLVRQGSLMPGNMHNKISSPEQAIFAGLKGSTLLESFQHFIENKLVEKMTIIECEFNEKAFGELAKVLSTTSNLQIIEFELCCFQGEKSKLEEISKNKNLSNIRDLEIYVYSDFNFLQSLCKAWSKYWCSLRSLSIELSKTVKEETAPIGSLCSGVLKDLAGLTFLSLSFHEDHKVTDECINILCCEGLRHLEKLQTLKLNFRGNRNLTDKGVFLIYSEGLKYLCHLTCLDLNFSNCNITTDEAITYFSSQDFPYLRQLESLSLNVGSPQKAFDTLKKIKNLQAFKSLVNLKSLALDFVGSILITGEDILSIYSEILPSLNQLESLSLSFPVDQNITNKCDIYFETFKSLNCLKSLEICLSKSSHSFDKNQMEGASLLDFKILYSSSSKELYLRLFNEIKDEELSEMCLKVLEHVRNLTSLTLGFKRCYNITDTGILNLCREGLQKFTELETLDLFFSELSEITDDAFVILHDQGLKTLTKLKQLNLEFDQCNGMCEKKWYMFKDGVSQLPNYSYSWHLLSSFFLSKCGYFTTKNDHYPLNRWNRKWRFHRAINSEEPNRQDGQENNQYKVKTTFNLKKKISQKKISKHPSRFPKKLILAQEKTPLTSSQEQEIERFFERSLEGISKNFSKSIEDGIGSLRSKDLNQLKELYIDFSKISNDEEIGILATECFKCFPNLSKLKLNASECHETTDKSMESLVDKGFRHLPKLTKLDLDFSFSGVTIEGFKILLSKGIHQLEDLTDLEVNFEGCEEDSVERNFTFEMKILGFETL